MKMTRTLIGIGDSLAIIIPKPVCELLNFKKGNSIEVILKGGKKNGKCESN